MALRFACAHVWRAMACFCLLTATFGCGDGSASGTGSADSSVSERPNAQPRDSVTLSWIPPTENTDGTYLDDLAGYRIYSGASPDDLAPRVTLDNPSLSRYVVEPLAPDELYFAITALNSSGLESGLSEVVKLSS